MILQSRTRLCMKIKCASIYESLSKAFLIGPTEWQWSNGALKEKATHQFSLRFCTPRIPEYNVDGTYKSFGDSVVGRERDGRINTFCI